MTARKNGNAAPRYVQLAESIAREIKAGKYGLGDFLPPELELCKRHNVSRHTVRESLRKLTEMGLISRRRREGTTIRARSPQARYTASISSMAELFQYAKRPRYSILSEKLVSVDAATAKALKCKRGDKWLKFEATRHQAGSPLPISYTEIYVHPAYEGVGASLRKKNPLIYSFIERHFQERVIEMQQKAKAVSMPERAAKLVKVKAGTPALEVARHFVVHGNRVIAVSTSVYPEGRFELSMTWRVTWGKE
jgi:GntR family transcriptional regulator